MAFFRTKERQRDPEIDRGARQQRRQQQQLQQQLLQAHRTSIAPPLEPAV